MLFRLTSFHHFNALHYAEVSVGDGMDERTPIGDMKPFGDIGKKCWNMRGWWDVHENTRQIVKETAYVESHSSNVHLPTGQHVC